MRRLLPDLDCAAKIFRSPNSPRTNPTLLLKTVLLLLVMSSTIFLFPCFSQEVPEAVKTARILDSQEVDLGNHKITYNRIESPKLKPDPPKEVAAPVESASMTAQEAEELRKWEATFQDSLFLGVTVYDGKFSEVRWWDEGHENVVWSNVNFMHFTLLSDLETSDAYYWLMLWGWETTTAEVKAMNAEAQTREELTPLPPATLPPLAKAGPKWQAASLLSEGAKRAMRDFHEYYRKHGAQMAVDYARREAEAKAHEEWLKSHPPIPPDTVINYFPIQSAEKEQAK